MESMDTLDASRTLRRRYYRALLVSFLLLIPSAVAFVLVAKAAGLEAPRRGMVVGSALAVELALGVAFSIHRYLRCPSCNLADWALAFMRPKPRTCPRCGATIA